MAKVITATKEGRIYIKNSDFFKQQKVRSLIAKLKDSSIYKEIEAKRIEENKENDELVCS